jgi:hypothetical protein
MDRSQLTPLAEILVRAYLDTALHSRQFNIAYEQPPTKMAKIHHLLAIAQAHVIRDDRWQLCPEFSEYGKLQVVDLTTNRTYLIRSSAAVAIEDRRQQAFPFPREVQTPIIMVVHQFHREGLDLSMAGTCAQPGRRRLVASGPATFIATWPFTIGTIPTAFDQGKVDPFRELGDLADEELGDPE